MTHALCVFCGSQFGTSPVFRESARAFGAALAERNCTLVYGGGSTGLMGAVADAVLDVGGEVIGIIPEFLASKEVLHPGINEQIIVTDLFQRKEKMIALSTAFVALPGGMGTFDDLIEILTWRQLNRLNAPLGLLNVEQYFQPLLESFRQAHQHGFYDLAHLNEMTISADIDTLLDELLAEN